MRLRKVRCWHFWRKHWDCGPMGHICLQCWKRHVPVWAALGVRCETGIINNDCA